MTPYLIAAAVVLAVPTIYLAVRSRDVRKFLAGAFFVSSGLQFYFYLVDLPIPLWGTSVIQSPDLSGGRALVHFLLFLACLYFGFIKRPSSV